MMFLGVKNGKHGIYSILRDFSSKLSLGKDGTYLCPRSTAHGFYIIFKLK